MSTEFLIKRRIFKCIAAILPVFFVLFAFVYASFLQSARLCKKEEIFYFLVSESTHIEASTHTAQMNGGAGYVLQTPTRDFVAYAAYLEETGAEHGRAVLQEQGESVQILSLRSGDLYVKTPEEKRDSKALFSAFSCLYSNISLLEQEISRLEKGATQESSKRVLEVLKRQFAFLRGEYATFLPEYAAVCEAAERALEESKENVVFVSDLRRVGCELCDSYMKLSKNFSL